MAIARCICGKKIDVSLQPLGSSEARECLSCGHLFCRDCSESYCALCGGVVVEADFFRISLFSCIAPLESPCDLTEVEELKERSSQVGMTLLNTSSSCVDALAEPGAVEVLNALVEQVRDRTSFILGELGHWAHQQQLHEYFTSMIAQTYFCAQTLPFIPRNRFGTIGFGHIISFLRSQGTLEDNSGVGPYDTRGLVTETLNWPVIDQALLHVELGALLRMGFAPDAAATPAMQPLLEELMRKGANSFSVGITEGILRAGALLTHGEHKRVHRRMAGHFLDHAATIIGKSLPLQSAQEILAVVNHCLEDHRPDIRAGSKAILWFAGLAPDPHPDGPDFGQGIQALGDGQLEVAAQHFTMGSSRGDADATYALAIFYEQGFGVKEDRKAARELMQAAAKADHLGAQGDMLLDGVDVARDVPLGIELLTRCAESGDVIAQVSRAGYSMSGELIPRDLEEARRWLKTAVIGGNPLALIILMGLADESESIGA